MTNRGREQDGKLVVIRSWPLARSNKMNWMLRILMIFALLAVVGCNPGSGPPSVSETSSARSSLKDRIQFVEQYVNFQRTYKNLEYSIYYKNNSYGMPGPSDWDIQLAAEVPADEVAKWISPDMKAGQPPKSGWHLTTASEIDVASVVEWYTFGGRSLGIDRGGSIVVYRHHTLGE